MDSTLTEAPEVTVVCITYKHEEYIAQALDSFLNQRTTFGFQIFVGEDCGPDGTAGIIRDYAERYPGIVIPFIREENMGAQRNLVDMCQRAGTKYIAFCEGDDYWVDDLKLQKQYDLMETHPELSGCFHNTRIESDDDWYLGSYYVPESNGDRLIPYSIPRYDRSIRVMRMGYYIRFGPAHTSSYFFRWNYDLNIPPWYFDTIFGDHPMMALQIGDGLLGFLPDVMSVYRRHAGGVIMSQSEREHHMATRRDWLIVLDGLERHFGEHFGTFARADIRARTVTEMRNYLAHAVKSGGSSALADIIAEHPLAFSLMIDDYVSTSRLRYRMISRLYGSDPAGLREPNLADALAMLPAGALASGRKKRQKRRALDYAEFAAIKKRAGLWLFMCDNQVSYRDNVRCFYEYVVERHPEIEAYWLTKSSDVLKMLSSEGLPVVKLRTARSRSLLNQAEVLFCQSLREDIFEMRGFNAGSRVVRLLDNQYYADHSQLIPHRSLDTSDDIDRESRQANSPRRWSHPGNLVVTDSGRQAQALTRLAGTGSGASIRHVPVEPRLLSIPEPLVPPGFRHVLFMPGHMAMESAEETVQWLIGAADELERLGRERGFVLQVAGRWLGRYTALVRDRLAPLDHLTLLETTDIHATLGQFSGAVTGVTKVAYSLFRIGVPVVVNPVGHDPETLARRGLQGVLPGPVASDWTAAVIRVTDDLGRPGLPPNAERIRAHFGLADDIAEDAMEDLFVGVRTWLEKGSA